jgi:hypothetical protein
VDTHAARCYAGAVRLAVLLLLLFLTPIARAEDHDDEPTGLSKRLRAIDESTEFEADHPERVGDDPADVAEEPADPTAAPTDESEPAAAPSRSRRAAPRPHAPSAAVPAPAAGATPPAPSAPPPPALGSMLESPIATSPLAPQDGSDDEY